jgi:GWxTD domain-containing protein
MRIGSDRLIRPIAWAVAASLIGACAGQPYGSPASPPPGEVTPAAPAAATAAKPPTVVPGDGPSTEGFNIYRQAGFLAQAGAIPFVGSVRFFAGPTEDSTLVLVALSLANRSFLFTPNNGINDATYSVTIAARDSAKVIAHVENQETIRVPTFRETRRADESVVFERYLVLPPGSFTLGVTVSDRATTASTAAQMKIVVPRLANGTLSSPTSVHQAVPRARRDSLPDLIANPRATLTFGADSIAPVYLEAYGLPAGSRIALTVLNPDGAAVVHDTVTLTRQEGIAAAIFDLPISRVGLGRRMLQTSVVGSPDTASTPLYVTVGEGLGIISFDDLLSYLRYFATPERLQALRDLPPGERAAGWAAFWRETDPDPATIENEALRDYFERITVANQRFKEQGTPGWLTDRGKVFITLGEPDQIMGSTAPSNTTSAHNQFWGYQRINLRLEFVDQNGFGRWRLTTQSEAAFEQVANSERAH